MCKNKQGLFGQYLGHTSIFVPVCKWKYTFRLTRIEMDVPTPMNEWKWSVSGCLSVDLRINGHENRSNIVLHIWKWSVSGCFGRYSTINELKQVMNVNLRTEMWEYNTYSRCNVRINEQELKCIGHEKENKYNIWQHFFIACWYMR